MKIFDDDGKLIRYADLVLNAIKEAGDYDTWYESNHIFVNEKWVEICKKNCTEFTTEFSEHNGSYGMPDGWIKFTFKFKDNSILSFKIEKANSKYNI